MFCALSLTYLVKFVRNLNTGNSQAHIKSVYIKRENVIKFCEECMIAVKAKPDHAKVIADVLSKADYFGHFSHGLNRLEMYVDDVLNNMANITGEPTISRETPSTACVNGNNCFGFVVGNFSMKLAIEKAKNTGVGWVVANGSNHYGIAGHYTKMAVSEGLLGMSFTNTSPLVFPTRSRKTALGTNPISVAAPAVDCEDDFFLDFATSTAALGKIEMCRRKKMPIPNGWGADSEGKPTNDAEVAYFGGLQPLGGEEVTGGYKGYALSMMVEIFCGLFSDASFGANVRSWKDHSREANLGQCFVAVDPEAFAPGFRDRMTNFAAMMRSLDPIDPSLPVIIPGDKEREHVKMCEKSGIPYPSVLIDSMDSLAKKLNVNSLERVGS